MILYLIEGQWVPTPKDARERQTEVMRESDEIKFPRIECYDLGKITKERLCGFLNELTGAVVDGKRDTKEDPRA